MILLRHLQHHAKISCGTLGIGATIMIGNTIINTNANISKISKKEEKVTQSISQTRIFLHRRNYVLGLFACTDLLNPEYVTTFS